MMRIYIKPTLYKNISDTETYALVRRLSDGGLVCDPVKKVWFFWVSKHPSPFYEPAGCWIKEK